MAPPADHPLELRHVSCQRGPAAVRDVSLAFATGTFTLLAGAVDSGHALLLRLLGMLEVPDRGELLLEGAPTHALPDVERTQLRDRRVGFIFAAPFLLNSFTPIENVAMPLFRVSDVESGVAQRRSEELLAFAGMPDAVQTPCSELSTLDQHRVALARALVNEPAVLLIENLDHALASDDLRAFAWLARQAAARFHPAVVATVSPDFLAEPRDRAIAISDGIVRHDSELLPRSEP